MRYYHGILTFETHTEKKKHWLADSNIKYSFHQDLA